MRHPLPYTLLLALLPLPAAAQVSLPAVFTDHMVLQRDHPNHIWGMAAPMEAVHVSLHGMQADTKAGVLGRWSVDLPPAPAGGPYTLTVAASNTITLHDLLMGDIWIASGQSNMEFTMQPQLPGFRGVKDTAKEVAAAQYSQLRMFHVRPATAASPQPDVTSTGSWQACTPSSVADFSAVAYFFGRDLLQKEKVPIGIIESDVGGTPAEAWTSMDALTSNSALMPVFDARAHMMDGQTTIKLEEKHEASEAEKAKAQGRTLPAAPWRPDPPTWAPAGLYNAMIAPLRPLRVRGFIWYQGESNTDAERAPVYGSVFRTMIQDWRRQWGEGDLPFLFVQIANYTSTDEWPMVREAQLQSLQLTNTGMAVAIDIGEPDNIHPRDKQDVGYRLSLWARDLAYGEHVEDSGPLFQEASQQGSAMRVWFSHAKSGLVARGGTLQSFEVAGADGTFVAGDAHIDGDSVIVSSAGVPQPVAVRYGWASAPACNLYNRDGLPAAPFTSQR